MAVVILNSLYPCIFFADEEHYGIKEYAEMILEKKSIKGDLIDRITSELGEVAVDVLLEKLGWDRIWMRGRFHYDFTNKSGDVRLEVKTRKRYCHKFEELDVRLDKKEQKNATEATHIVPLVYEPMDTGAKVTSPGVLDLSKFLNAVKLYQHEIPEPKNLKRECARAPWGVVFTHPEDFGFLEWEEFEEIFNG